MIARILSKTLISRIFTGKAIIVTGPRQVGKTTLLRELLSTREEATIWLNGDSPTVRSELANITSAGWRRITGRARIIVIDEAQQIENVGFKLKLITDELPEVQLIVSGSSALELGNQLNEPLTGRKWSFHLLPLSYRELENHHGYLQEKEQLEDRLLYGSYPEIIAEPTYRRERLEELANSYLFKDILSLTGIRKPDKLLRILQALAFQVGSEVSYHELGKIVDMDNQTVEKYLDLLEKAFVIFRLGPLSRNLRKELKTKRKIFFYDNGIRNVLISQLQPLAMRQDVGQLWENYLMTERRKLLLYERHFANQYFWRLTTGSELDYVEEIDGQFRAYEFKWNPRRHSSLPAPFAQAYPNHEFHVVHRENYADFLSTI